MIPSGDFDIKLIREELEKRIIGSLIADPGAFHDISGTIRTGYFSLHQAQKAYAKFDELTEAGAGITLTSLKLALPDLIRFLHECVNTTPSSKDIKQHAEILKKLQGDLELSQIGVHLAKGRFGSYDEVLDKVFDFYEEFANPTIAPDRIQSVKLYFHESYEPNIMPTGLKVYDRMFAGFFPELIILAARPSAGKTALALTFAVYQAFTLKKRVMFYSLEMTFNDLIMRVAANTCEIPLYKLRTNKLNDYERGKVFRWLDRVYSASTLFINDTSGHNEKTFFSMVQSDFRKYKPDIIYIDYLSYIHCSKAHFNPNDAISKVMDMIIRLKKTLRIPIVLLAQLNREIEKRSNPRPILSDIRDSGRIEQDADMVLAVDRPGAYQQNSFRVNYVHPVTGENFGTDAYGRADIIVLKQRNGKVGFFRTKFEGDFVRFSDILSDTKDTAMF